MFFLELSLCLKALRKFHFEEVTLVQSQFIMRVGVKMAVA